MEKEIHTQT
jgi:hypothetical protein